jgi:hypothetical protein
MRQSRAPSSPALVLCGVLLAPSAAVGQETVRRVSLAEAVEAFAGNSLELKIARSETAGLMGMVRQSRAYFNPEFSFERDDLSHNEEKAWEESFQLHQQVEWPGRTTARARAARHAIRAGAARFRADSVALAYEVREAYVRAWFAEEAESIVRRTVSVIQSVEEDAEVRLEAVTFRPTKPAGCGLPARRPNRSWRKPCCGPVRRGGISACSLHREPELRRSVRRRGRTGCRP